MTAPYLETPHTRLIALWIVRLFSTEYTQHSFFVGDRYADSEIAEFLGLPACESENDQARARKRLGELLHELEMESELAIHEPLASNLKRYVDAFAFDEDEACVIAFCVLAEIESVLKATTCVASRMLETKPASFFARVFRWKIIDTENLLLREGRLMSSRVLMTGSRYNECRSGLRFFSPNVARQLSKQACDESQFLRSIGLNQADAPQLHLSDYSHAQNQIEILLDYLRCTLARSKHGVNILVHGDPGTGKTQFTRVLARELGVTAYEFSVEDHYYAPKDADDRLSSMKMAALFFRNAKALLVFDEFEDILVASANDRGAINAHKGWFNRMLESNPIPVIWLSNSIDDLDPAFCRRFDFIIELPIPPRNQRETILRKHSGRHVSERTIQQLAQMECLAPAVVQRVSAVFDDLLTNMSEEQKETTYVRMVNSVLKAQGQKECMLVNGDQFPADVYDLRYLNTGANLEEMASLLRTHPVARICLHGPPGTGKTAFGHWLAREMNLQLRVERASDLLSPFFGETEMRLRRAFDKAHKENSILMVDEVDSFLQDRSKAIRSWEVSQVNELLTCMESFQGVFIATTNRLEHLDTASLRRFDMKLAFDYLDAAQMMDLLGKWCRKLDLDPPLPEHKSMLQIISCATPGDFAAIARRHRFSPFSDAGEIIRALQEDCQEKNIHPRIIGFR